MAEALSDDGHIDTFEYEDKHADFAQRYFDKSPWGNKIKIHRGAALDNLRNVVAPIDMSFIDADKQSELRQLLQPPGRADSPWRSNHTRQRSLECTGS